MSKEELKPISTQVSKECKKKLQKLAIDEDVSIKEYIRSILENYVKKKRNIENELEEVK